MRNVFYVAKTGNDQNDGSKEAPFLTISKAANVVTAGGEVIVSEGVYREWVKPRWGGCHEGERITYRAAEGEKVVIKGSDVVENWVQVEGTVWKAEISNITFGDYNPYETAVEGDWLKYPQGYRVHTGDVYINGKSMYEAKSLEDVKTAEKREFVRYRWSRKDELLMHPEDTIYQWYATVGADTTEIYGNFQDVNPNEACVEINVRRSCFTPAKTGISYITVRGFEIAQAATKWAPPTADQMGIVGPNWSKGWIIEDNHIHDAKCSAVCLGKDYQTGEEYGFHRGDKTNHQYQLEAVFEAEMLGWTKEKVGSHIVRNNIIHDCGQNGVVGHMGCAFSEITGNRIYNIGVKREFFGWELAGIKFHAAIDTQITRNCIHDCTLGFWMDWQAQGTRISRNILFNNDTDGYIEVTHGPMIIDNNMFLSELNVLNFAQGTAFMHNLFAGYQVLEKVLDRATPYHFPHSTRVKGYAFVHNGDDRYHGNIFGNGDAELRAGDSYGTVGYKNHPESLEAFYAEQAAKDDDHAADFEVEQAVYISENVYLDGATHYAKEHKPHVSSDAFRVKAVKEGEEVYLVVEGATYPTVATSIKETKDLGAARFTLARFEAPNGDSIRFAEDIFGEVAAGEERIAGPILAFAGENGKQRIW